MGNKLQFDQYGLLGQPYPEGLEGGDSASWTGLYIFFTGDTSINYDNLEVSSGAYVRHHVPHPTLNRFGSYYANPYDGVISRDQLTGVILARIGQKNTKAILRILVHHALRLFLFSYNTRKNGVHPEDAPWKLPDITFMDIWALYLRGLPLLGLLLYPLLCLFDLHLLFNAVNVRYIKKEQEHVLNYLGKLICAKRILPTPLSMLAWAITDMTQMKKALETYWCGWRKQCGMVGVFTRWFDSVPES